MEAAAAFVERPPVFIKMENYGFDFLCKVARIPSIVL